MTKLLSVLSYPEDEKNLNYVVDTLNNFITYLNREYKLKLNIEVHPLFETNVMINTLLNNYLTLLENTYNFIDIDRIVDLFEIIKNPTIDKLDLIRPSYVNNNEMWDFFLKTRLVASSFKIKDVFQFITLKNINLKSGQGPWGITGGRVYPFSISAVTKNFKEIIYHEFLHQLNITEGYDDNFDPTCSTPCWMQYNPTLADSICTKHSHELIEFARTL